MPSTPSGFQQSHRYNVFALHTWDVSPSLKPISIPISISGAYSIRQTKVPMVPGNGYRCYVRHVKLATFISASGNCLEAQMPVRWLSLSNSFAQTKPNTDASMTKKFHAADVEKGGRKEGLRVGIRDVTLQKIEGDLQKGFRSYPDIDYPPPNCGNSHCTPLQLRNWIWFKFGSIIKHHQHHSGSDIGGDTGATCILINERIQGGRWPPHSNCRGTIQLNQFPTGSPPKVENPRLFHIPQTQHPPNTPNPRRNSSPQILKQALSMPLMSNTGRDPWQHHRCSENSRCRWVPAQAQDWWTQWTCVCGLPSGTSLTPYEYAR